MTKHMFRIFDLFGLAALVRQVGNYLINREIQRIKNVDQKLDNTRKFLEMADSSKMRPEEFIYYVALINGDKIKARRERESVYRMQHRRADRMLGPQTQSSKVEIVVIIDDREELIIKLIN